MADEATDTTTSPTNETAATEQQATDAATANDSAADKPAADTATEDSALSNAGVTAKEGEDAKADADKGEEGDKPKTDAPRAPEKYELALEGVDLDAEMVTEAEPILRELDLDNDQANKLLPVANKLVERTTENLIGQLEDAAAQQKADWLKISKEDETIGGANWDQSMHLAGKAFDALGFKEGHPFRTALAETGFGNNRDMIFAFAKFGEMVGEDGTFAREAVGATQEADIAKRLYPDD